MEPNSRENFRKSENGIPPFKKAEIGIRKTEIGSIPDLHQKKISGSSFKKKAIEWLEYFLTPSQERPNKNFVRGLYRATDYTPYMHVLTYHIPEFIEIHRDLGLMASIFTPPSLFFHRVQL